MATIRAQQEALAQLLDSLENGSAALNRSDLVRQGLRLMASTTTGNVFVDVSKKVETTSSSTSPSANVDPAAAAAADDNEGESVADATNSDAAMAKATTTAMMADQITTVSSSCVLSVKSSLSFATPTDAAAMPPNPSPLTAKHRLLLYRFLLNGLADLSGERQLLMAAAPMFTMEASETHVRNHALAVDAILLGVMRSSNNALRDALKITTTETSCLSQEEKKVEKDADEEQCEQQEKTPEGSAPQDDKTNAHARKLLLGLVLYFEQKTGSSIFTGLPSASPSASFSAESILNGTGLTVNNTKSKQGRFFELVMLLSYVVAEGQVAGESSAAAAATASPTTASAASPEAHFLSTLFILLYRLVPTFLPLRGDEALFHSSALPDLLRLLLQYHDPILSSHLDQHPAPRKRKVAAAEAAAADAANDNDNEGASHLDAKKAVSAASLVQVQPATSMADAAYQYLTGLGAAIATSSCCGAPPCSSVGSPPSAEALALLDLFLLRYDDAYYFGCLSFIATVIFHRGTLLQLQGGEAIAQFWSVFANSGGFGDKMKIALTAESILAHEKASKAAPGADIFGHHAHNDEDDEKEKSKSEEDRKNEEFVKKHAAMVLTYQSLSAHKDRIPPVLEPISGLLLALVDTPAAASAEAASNAADAASSSSLPPLAALIAVVVQNLAKSTPSSAKVFATAILSIANGTNGGAAASGSNSDIYNAIAASPLAVVPGQTISDALDRQRGYVSSFPVMPVTAEELVLVFPAGGQLVAAPPTTAAAAASEATENSPPATEGNATSEDAAAAAPSQNASTSSSSPSSSSARAPPSGGDPSVVYSSSHLQYLVLDSRAENSFLFARLPTAIHIGSGIGFDTQQLQATVLQLQDAWGSHLTIMGTGRSIVEEMNLLKLIAIRLVEKGFPHVSIVDGGFKACIPYLKSGQMEFVQSPQNIRDECAARDAAARNPPQPPHPAYHTHTHVDPHNASRSTLNTEELTSELAAQAYVLKDQALIVKDIAAEQAHMVKEKASEGLKKTTETVSEAATTAATWGASVWGKLSAGVATAREKVHHSTTAAAPAAHPPPAAGSAPGAPTTAPARQSTPWVSSSTSTAATHQQQHHSEDATQTQAPASSGFFSTLLSKAESVIASNKLGEPPLPAVPSALNAHDGAAAAAVGTATQHCRSNSGTVNGGGGTGDILFVTSGHNGIGGDDEDDDDDLGLITTVDTKKPSVSPQQQQAEPVVVAAETAPTAPRPAAAPVPTAAVAEGVSSVVVPAATPMPPSLPLDDAPAAAVGVESLAATPAQTVETASAPAAALKPADVAPTTTATTTTTTTAIDDLFDDLIAPAAGNAGSSAASHASSPTKGTTTALPATSSVASPSPAKPAAAATAASTAPSKSATGNAFEDIFGDDF